MDGAIVPNTKSSDGQDILQSAQSATQSQQFKTVEETKKNLNSSSQGEITLKKNLKASPSPNSPKNEESATPVPPAVVIEPAQPIFSKEVSEAAMPIENMVIEERDENDEEERKTGQAMQSTGNRFNSQQPPQLQSQQVG